VDRVALHDLLPKLGLGSGVLSSQIRNQARARPVRWVGADQECEHPFFLA
jgi:hypothetical protein